MGYLKATIVRTTMAAMILSALAAPMLADEPAAKPESKQKSAPAKVVKLFNGKNLDGVKIVDKFDFEKHGKVEVKDREIRLAEGKPATGVSFTGKLPRSNYEVSLEAKRTDGSDFFCGLTFPVGDEYCSLILGGWGGDVTGLSNVDNMAADENATTGYVDFKNGQWYKVRLRVTDKTISAWVDKELIVELDRAERKFGVWWEQEPVRPLGVATWRTSAALRNIKLTRLGEAGDEPAESNKPSKPAPQKQ